MAAEGAVDKRGLPLLKIQALVSPIAGNIDQWIGYSIVMNASVFGNEGLLWGFGSRS